MSLRDAITYHCHIFLTRLCRVYPRVQEASLILNPPPLLSVWLVGLHNERLSPWLSPLLNLPVCQWQRRLQHQQGGVSGRWVSQSIGLLFCLFECVVVFSSQQTEAKAEATQALTHNQLWQSLCQVTRQKISIPDAHFHHRDSCYSAAALVKPAGRWQSQRVFSGRSRLFHTAWTAVLEIHVAARQQLPPCPPVSIMAVHLSSLTSPDSIGVNNLTSKCNIFLASVLFFPHNHPAPVVLLILLNRLVLCAHSSVSYPSSSRTLNSLLFSLLFNIMPLLLCFKPVSLCLSLSPTSMPGGIHQAAGAGGLQHRLCQPTFWTWDPEEEGEKGHSAVRQMQPLQPTWFVLMISPLKRM